MQNPAADTEKWPESGGKNRKSKIASLCVQTQAPGATPTPPGSLAAWLPGWQFMQMFGHMQCRSRFPAMCDSGQEEVTAGPPVRSRRGRQ